MSKTPKIPTTYTINTNLGGGVDIGLDDIRVTQLPLIRLATQSSIKSDSKVDMGLDNLRIREIAPINTSLTLAMKPTRVHFPVNMHFGVGVLGVELLKFSVCGESMVVVEDYVPHKTELCL